MVSVASTEAPEWSLSPVATPAQGQQLQVPPGPLELALTKNRSSEALSPRAAAAAARNEEAAEAAAAEVVVEPPWECAIKEELAMNDSRK